MMKSTLSALLRIGLLSVLVLGALVVGASAADLGGTDLRGVDRSGLDPARVDPDSFDLPGPDHPVVAAVSLPGDREALIRRFYDAQERIARESGFDLRTNLSGFVTWFSDDYDDVRWLDLLSLPEGEQLVAPPTRYYHAGTGESVVHYEFAWEPVPPGAERMTAYVREHWTDYTARRALVELQRLGTLGARPFAITRFDVELSFEGRLRSYRGAALFSVGNDRTLQVSLQDNVAVRVDKLLQEDRPIRAMAEVDALQERWMGRERGQDFRTFGESTTALCESERYEKLSPGGPALDGIEGHSDGKHRSWVNAKVTCTADPDCTLHCRGDFNGSGCVDYGTLADRSCHHSVSTDQQAGFGASQYDSVTCGVALGCAVEECCGGSCSASLGFDLGGTQAVPTLRATFSAERKVYRLSVADGVACPSPQLIENDPCSGGCVDEPDGGADPGPGPAEDPFLASPILLDLDQRGFRLTSLENGVRFDLDRDGTPERVAWTEAASGDAFLVLDRNGNGLIDDGGELFGDLTDQPASDEPTGYRALALFDANADGVITASDEVFDRLLLWTDCDHDGSSSPEELQSLSDAEVRGIHLEVVESNRRDRHGSRFRYVGRVDMVRSVTQSTDVFLVTAP